MLGKLMKYELQATARWFLPAYGLLMVMAIITRIFLGVRDTMTPERDYMATPQIAESFGNLMVTLATMFYVFLIAAVFIATIIIIIQRFYKNLMGDEGYLMFTLPVRPWENITSKLVVAMVWMVASFVVFCASMLVLMLNPDFMEIWNEMILSLMQELSELGMQGPLVIWLVIATGIMSTVYMVVHIYAAIAIGQLSNNHRVLCAFGAYLGIMLVENIIGSILSFFLMFNPNGLFGFLFYGEYSGMGEYPGSGALVAQMNIAMGAGLLMTVVLTAALFYVTNYILSKKLNLE